MFFSFFYFLGLHMICSIVSLEIKMFQTNLDLWAYFRTNITISIYQQLVPPYLLWLKHSRLHYSIDFQHFHILFCSLVPDKLINCNL